MAWIRTIAADQAEGRLAEVYQWQAETLGRPTEFTELGSLDPELVLARLVLYRASENVDSSLTVEQCVLISYLTSILNDTPHCSSVSRAAMERLDGQADVRDALDRRDYDALAPADTALARYVEKLTLTPALIGLDDIEALRTAGFGDLEIVHANNQCAHLNYTNRVANGLGLRHEAPPEERSAARVPTARRTL
jgi:uncharacterized peroxidase-related enzyme